MSLSTNGPTLVVGDPQNTENNIEHVRIFMIKDNDRTQVGTNIDKETVDNYSGNSVYISSDGVMLTVGAPNNGRNGSKNKHVCVFKIVYSTTLSALSPADLPTNPTTF